MASCKRKCPNSVEFYTTERIPSSSSSLSKDISRPSLLSSVVSTALPVIAEMATDKAVGEAVGALTNAFANSFSISDTTRSSNPTQIDCKFGFKCNRANCRFDHPMCRYDDRCTRPGCSYKHSTGVRIPFGSGGARTPARVSARSTISMPECNRGVKCLFNKQGRCKFYHPEDESDETSD